MATIMIFQKMLKTLRENGNVKEKREVLTYISSQAKKLETSGVIKEERYKELCRLVIEAFTKHDGNLQNEALIAFNAIMQEFQAHSLQLFESMLRTDTRTRLKIVKDLLEVVEDNAISAAANDGQTLSFFKDCMHNVLPHSMEWLKPTACVDNLEILTKAEHQLLSDEEKLDEDLISYSLALLRRLYKLASITFDQNIHKFDILLMDKIITLAYMGHKRQRGPALKVLQQAVTTNSSLHICKNYPDLWAQYKANLQSTYCKRMLLLVATCDPDWAFQWNTTIQFLGTDLHRGASLINNLLSVEEKAFKSTDPIIRRQAFLSWKLLIDNFALDHQELATARRIKLLCIPLNAKNSKTELIALTKLEVWWHLIIKLYKDIAKFATPVITQFLNYCFGPLGDTPLLSSKFDIVASPGKRFFKTKVVAVNALCQLVVRKEDLLAVCAPMLEERLPHVISDEVFQECSKSIIHSVGEALLILGQLTDQEMKNSFQLGKKLWTNLMMYITDTTLATKNHLYRDVILVVTELGNHIDKLMVKDMIFNIILPDVAHYIIKEAKFHDNALPKLVLKFISVPILNEVPKDYYNDAIKCLLEWCVNSEFTNSSDVFEFLETIMENLRSVSETNKNMEIYIKLGFIIAEILTKYITNSEANENEHYFKTVKLVLSFPFQYACLKSLNELQDEAVVWKALYKQFEKQSSAMNTVKTNEILLDIASMMRDYLNKNKNCCSFIINCLDTLLLTIDYESLLAQDEIPSIMQLILDVITTSFNNVQNLDSEVALKTLSAMLIIIYGHNPQKAVLYLLSCKSVVELILASQIKELFKEVANMWEYVISIFKGLKKQLNHELLSSYKETIVIAMNHPNPDIRSVTQSIFEIKDGLDRTVKCILDEIEKMAEQSVSHSKSDIVPKKKAKEAHITGSFLNKQSTNIKSGSSKPSGKDDKNTLISSEPDSQDYVYIKTDLKFDVNRLTEHQKETLKKKRDDIPALYNDLSQSSSQNSQNLQEWFNIKTKHINESEKVSNKKSDSVTQNPVDNDANKENKDIIIQTELSNVIDKVVDNICSSKLDKSINEDIIDTKQNEDSKEVKKKGSNEKQDENINTSKRTNSISHVASCSGQITVSEEDKVDVTNTITSIAKKLNFDSREEFPDNETHERKSSPSMLDSTKRRGRNSITKSKSSLKNDEVTESLEESSTTNVQKTLRMKISQEKPGTSGKRKSVDDTDVKENSDEKKRSIKRKYVSDTESDGILQHRKRKLKESTKLCNTDCNTDDDVTSVNKDNIFSDIDMDSVSRRTKSEISRLKIDMVFDCPAVNRRRVKQSNEGEKDTCVHELRKHETSDKSSKLKSNDVKYAEKAKKSPKTLEKNTKDTDDIDQATFKRRSSRRSTKQECNKNDLDVNKEVRQSNDTIDKVPELKNSTDTNMTRVISMSSQTTQDVATNKTKDKKLDKDNSKSNSNLESSVLTETNRQSDDEDEDVVESSQSLNISLKLDKICGDKQCFIMINKIKDACSVKTSDIIVDKNYVPESIPMDYDDNDVPDSCKKSDEANLNNNTENDGGNKLDINKDLVQETDNSNPKTIVLEDQKTTDNSSSIKPASVTNFSSPKSNSKVFSKLKPFTGRAAHMLGLVTKQSRIENDNLTIVLEDETSIKKLKIKETENETSTSKKTLMVKEIDKIGGPSGSRQEKIFSNMRSADYCVSLTPSFTTLRNDGEKLSFKLDKSTSEYSSMETSVDKENEGNVSPLREKDDLPILEWSSANPPSLTASPSASILKRHRSSIPEPDFDSTPNKRKRVSFADPPVSKEMGYEISITGSPQKTNKYSTTRSPMSKKDSPFKFKQTKLKFLPTDVEKIIIEDDTENENNIEVVEVEKKNESLIKVFEEYSENTDTDKQIPGNVSENYNVEENSHARINIEDLELAQEIEVTSALTVDSLDPHIPEDQQLLSSEYLQNSANTTLVDDVGTEDSETQQDIFDEMDTKNNITLIQTNNDDINMSIQNISNNSNSIKLNVTDDSVIAALSIKDDSANIMEDTVDVQNITELNSTVNTDEIFCGKLIHTSTHTTENVADQDTLPITDSVFESLQLTQNTQDEEILDDVELEPQFLDPIQPIYPKLSSCAEPIDTILEQLTYPLWKQNLCTYLTNRSLRTIGDLAQLSEREINRLPLKGKSKINFLKKVLRHFESKYVLQAKSSDKISNVKVEKLPTVEKTAILPVVLVSDIKAESRKIDNESLSCSTPLNRSSENILDNRLRETSSTEHLDKTESITSDVDISSEHTYSGNPDPSVLGISIEDEQINIKAQIATQSSPGTSSNVEPVAIFSSSSKNIATVNEVASSNVNINASEAPIESLNTYDELLITHSSVGTNTDEIGSLKPTVPTTTRSVESQMALEELLDEIDVNLVLESAVRRCSSEAILSQYKIKMGHLSESDLVKETIKMLRLQNKQQLNDVSLKAACRSCGVNKVLLRLPDIFSHDKQFFDKVLKLYSKKLLELNIADSLNVFDFNQLKNAICQKCTSSELIGMLSEKLKQEEQEGIKQPMSELSSLDAMLQRLPMDVIISHTVANEELIPAQVVLDIALQNNSSGDIAQALNQSPVKAKRVVNKLWTSQFTIAHIDKDEVSKESLLSIFQSVCSKLTAQELLNAYHEAMASKLIINDKEK